MQKLREEKLYARRSKCEFGKTELLYLGHIVGQDGVRVDGEKVDAITKWPKPATRKDLRSFMGLAGYYRKFIEKFAHRLRPMSELLKTDVPWTWGAAQDAAFQDIKQAMTTAPVLAVPDASLPYEVYTDASGFGVGAVLLQDQGKGLQPCAYISHKLSDAERKYATHEQELLAIIHALKVWRPYLEGAVFKVNSDHKALEVLATQPKLSRRQASWVEFLQAYDCKVKYVEGQGNHADALSRRPDLINTAALNQGVVWDTSSSRRLQCGSSRASPTVVHSNGHRGSCAACTEEHASGARQVDSVNTMTILTEDSSFMELLKGALPGDDYHKRNRFLKEEGDLVYLGRLLYIPPQLRSHVMREAHEPSYSGHLGTDKTCAGIKRRFWWPHLRKSVRRYIGRCGHCQRSKPRATKLYGGMHPIPAPSRPWEQITMDLITALPTTTQGHDAMIVFVDRMTKMIRCAPTTKKLSAQGTAQLFKDTIFRYHGLPEVIIADRDPRWNSMFWRSVFQSLQTKTRLSTAYHPHTDGQTERANRTIEEMMRSYVHPFGDDWDQHLCDVEFAYNNSEQKSTGQTPFYLLHGFHPRTPIDLYNPAVAEHMPAADHFVKQILQGHEAAKSAMEYASQQQKEQFDKKRTESPFKQNDWVYLSSKNCKFQGRTDKLTARFMGPYKIQTMSDDGLAATLRLPSTVRIHPTVHVNRLKAYKGDYDASGAPKSASPPEFGVEDEAVDDDEAIDTSDLRIEGIVAFRKVHSTKEPHALLRHEYLVKWAGHEDSDNTWLSRTALKDEQEHAIYLENAGYLDEEESVQKPR